MRNKIVLIACPIFKTFQSEYFLRFTVIIITVGTVHIKQHQLIFWELIATPLIQRWTPFSPNKVFCIHLGVAPLR